MGESPGGTGPPVPVGLVKPLLPRSGREIKAVAEDSWDEAGGASEKILEIQEKGPASMCRGKIKESTNRDRKRERLNTLLTKKGLYKLNFIHRLSGGLISWLRILIEIAKTAYLKQSLAN